MKFSPDNYNSLIFSKLEMSFDTFCNCRYSYEKFRKDLLKHIDAEILAFHLDEFKLEGICHFQIDQLQEF
jgi:hypothetical protein